MMISRNFPEKAVQNAFAKFRPHGVKVSKVIELLSRKIQGKFRALVISHLGQSLELIL